VLWRDARRRSPDPRGQIWRDPVIFFIAVWLRWRELWSGRRRALGFSINNPLFSFIWRLDALVLCCGTR
jgi:hypothetical protein